MSTGELTRIIKPRALAERELVIEANAQERAALAKRFGLVRIDSFRADLTLDKEGEAVLVQGSFCAEIVQNCAVSGEAFPTRLEENIALRFVPEAAAAPQMPEPQNPQVPQEVEIELAADDLDEIAYDGDFFDLGEALAQSMGLAIDPYASGPDADAAREAAGIGRDDAPSGPLAEALKGLKSQD